MFLFTLGWGHHTEFKDRWGTPHEGVGTPHITPHTTQNQGGDTAQENVFRCSHWGEDTTQNSKKEGGTLHKIKVGCWLAGSMIIVPIKTKIRPFKGFRQNNSD